MKKISLQFSWIVHIIILLNNHAAFPQSVAKTSFSNKPASATPSPGLYDSVMKPMEWRLIGPFRGGRSVTVAGHPTQRLTAYMGTTGGGVWKTIDGGNSWKNVSDGFMKTGSVGAIAVSTSNPDIVYVGMGEHTLRGNLINGDGVYKSTDAGKTWTHIGLKDSYHIGRLIIHPSNPDIVYVAAIGHAFGPNEERGVFRTKDGGKTWTKILYKNPDAGAVDLTIDPANPYVLYASTFEFRRYPWGVRSAGPGSGIHKTTNGGDTWTDITKNPGLPTGLNRGRIGVALSPSRPKRVWAIIEAENNQTGVYRTDDAGATWMLVSQFAELSQRPWYYHHITADPQNSESVWIMNIGMWKSTDGGKKYVQVSTPHGDNHDLWIDPKDTTRMVQANDGGGTLTYDGGKSWSTIYNQPTAQMYHVITDNKFPYRVYGSQQDNTTISVPGRSDNGAIYPAENYQIGGGESGYIAFNKNDPKVFYAANHHWLTRYDINTNQLKNVSVVPEDMYGYGSADLKYRFQWTYPVVISDHNPKILYATSQYVHRSVDQGNSWEIISPNLSRSDPETLEKTPTPDDSTIGKYWGPIKRDNTGVEWYGTVFALAESPVKAGVLWAGSDDGFVHVSTDNGKSWKNITPKDIPEFARVSIIDPSPHDPATAYIAANRDRLDDFRPYLYKTTDYGKTWKKITAGIAEKDFTRVIREDPARKGLLYAGTENGMYVSFNDGKQWQSLQMNLPLVPIHDLAIQDNDLVAATHGRSFWVLDDLTLLRQLVPEMENTSVYLFKPRKTVRFKGDLRPAIMPVPANPEHVGKNPPNGVMVNYFLKNKPQGKILLEFIDADGQVIKQYKTNDTTSKSLPSPEMNPEEGRRRTRELTLTAKVGGNKFVWEDMRYDDPVSLPNAVTHGSAKGPVAMPGKYKVRLTVDGKSYTQDFEIVKDPRITASQEDFKAQFALLLKIRERINELRMAVLDIRKIRKELDSLEKINASGSVNTQNQFVSGIKDKLLRIEDALYQFRAKANQDLTNYPVRLHTKLTALAGFVESDDSKPTKQEYEQYEILSRSLAGELKKLTDVKVEYTAKTKMRSF